MPASSSPEDAHRLALAFVDATSAHDWAALRQITSREMRHQLLPRSLGRPARTRDEWLGTWETYLGLIPDISMKLEGEILAGDGFACFRANSHGTTTSGVAYDNEYMFIIRVSADQSGDAKITSMDEMCDSAAISAFMGNIASAQT